MCSLKNQVLLNVQVEKNQVLLGVQVGKSGLITCAD